MATVTPNYRLRQWEAKDRPDRAGLNKNFETIDTVLDQKANQALLNGQLTSINSSIGSLQNTMNSQISSLSSTMDSQFSSINSAIESLQGRVNIVLGSYTGNSTFPRTVYLGFTPRAVLVECQNGRRSDTANAYGGLITPGMPLSFGEDAYAEILTDSLRLNIVQTYNQINVRGSVYTYIAFG